MRELGETGERGESSGEKPNVIKSNEMYIEAQRDIRVFGIKRFTSE